MDDVMERFAEFTAELIRNGILDRIKERKEREAKEALNNKTA